MTKPKQNLTQKQEEMGSAKRKEPPVSTVAMKIKHEKQNKRERSEPFRYEDEYAGDNNENEMSNHRVTFSTSLLKSLLIIERSKQ